VTKTGRAVLIASVVGLPTLTVVAALLLFFTPLGMNRTPFYGARFDPQRWRTAHQGKTPNEIAKRQAACIRGPMYGDLKDRLLPPGTGRKRVVALLGAPDFGSEGVYRGYKCQRWNLGFCSGFKIDLDSLNVCFDKAGKVRRVFRLQH
jgi:hypothetical protein